MTVANVKSATPTQAQIEAAIEGFSNLGGCRLAIKFADGSQLKDRIAAALTAAAQVKMKKYPEPETASELINRVLDRATVNATIERCAQVAETASIRLNQSGESSTQAAREAIAAAIRALATENKP